MRPLNLFAITLLLKLAYVECRKANRQWVNRIDFTRADRSERVIATVFQSALSEKERAAVRDMDTLGIDAPQAVKSPRRTPVFESD